jgi:lipoprotein-anchoring transpeptidase ErfK/SrfK
MSRRRRVSRALIGVLSITIALGLVFWLHNLTKSKAGPAAGTARVDVHTPPPPPSAAPTAKVAKPETPAAAAAKPSGLITQTPTAPLHTTVTPTVTPTVAPTASPIARPGEPASAGGLSSPSTRPSATGSLADAQARLDAGDFLAARNMLNASLSSGKLADADVKAAKLMLNKVSDTVIFSPRKFASDTITSTYDVKSGDRLDRIARQYEVTTELLQRINNLPDPRKMKAGANLKVVTGPFNAVVDKSDFMLEIWLGNPGESGAMYVTSFPVGLGRDDSTPTGTWIVETQKKLKNPTYYSPRGEGIIQADDPDNPLGEYWIGLTGVDGHANGKQSYGIHGTIRPDSIGRQESMGCVRLVNDDVAKVFELLVEGKSMVLIRD